MVIIKAFHNCYNAMKFSSPLSEGSYYYSGVTDVLLVCIYFTDLTLSSTFIPGNDQFLLVQLLCQLLMIQGDTKKRELLKNPTKIEEIKKKILTEIETLQLAF